MRDKKAKIIVKTTGEFKDAVDQSVDVDSITRFQGKAVFFYWFWGIASTISIFLIFVPMFNETDFIPYLIAMGIVITLAIIHLCLMFYVPAFGYKKIAYATPNLLDVYKIVKRESFPSNKLDLVKYVSLPSRRPIKKADTSYNASLLNRPYDENNIISNSIVCKLGNNKYFFTINEPFRTYVRVVTNGQQTRAQRFIVYKQQFIKISNGVKVNGYLKLTKNSVFKKTDKSTESINFNKTFDVNNSTDELTATKILRPGLIQRLVDLDPDMRNKEILFTGDQIQVNKTVDEIQNNYFRIGNFKFSYSRKRLYSNIYKKVFRDLEVLNNLSKTAVSVDELW